MRAKCLVIKLLRGWGEVVCEVSDVEFYLSKLELCCQVMSSDTQKVTVFFIITFLVFFNAWLLFQLALG